MGESGYARTRIAAAALITAGLCIFGHGAEAQDAPDYYVDPGWPEPLPNQWKLGGVIGLGVDQNDDIWVYHRPTDLTSVELEAELGISDCCVRPPSMIHISKDGSYLGSFDAPQGHGMDVDEYGFAYLGQDTVRKYDTRTGAVVGEIARTAERPWGIINRPRTIPERIPGNGGPSPLTRFLKPPHGPTPDQPTPAQAAEQMAAMEAFYEKYPPSTPMIVGTIEEIRVDESHDEIYVADNYLDGRVLVFDLDTLAFKRGWGAYGKPLADISLDPADHEWQGDTPPTEFEGHLTVNYSRDGFVYAADRAADRVQVFTREGEFVRELVFSPPGTRRSNETGSRGVAGGVTLSADPAQQFLYVADMKNNTIWFVDRMSGTVLGRFGSMGENAGQFFGLELAVTDSRNNIYTGEVFGGKRVQRLVPAHSPRGTLLRQLAATAP